METFIWVIVIVMSFETAAKVLLLGIGRIPESKPLVLAIDSIIASALIVWGACILYGA